jgi:DNA invertase Pin-like site-specific DNA recombinase
MTAKRLRCAVYTRKSTEEGLEQAFNTLDAQRDACAAYVRSQVGEGWHLLPAHYDDGGFSGGNMDRPALKRLLEDIDAGKVDVVVVYKVDRLTRSLVDFARIVERFEARSVSFVSVTQSFNTTSSMGRLTLNVLLSFAQFEREVTGERIRDKIAASKAKGLWMGGYPPLGYDPDGRTLKTNAKEAETVRMIFRRYLELGCVRALESDLNEKGARSKSWTTAGGRQIEGTPLVRGALYYMLRNRLYRGEIRHKGHAHPGQHPAIVDAELFDAVQARLNEKVRVRRERPTRLGGSPLTGLLFDSAGESMSPAYARGKAGGSYRYYVSTSVQKGRPNQASEVSRIPAKAVEELVQRRVRAILGRWDGWDQIRETVSKVLIKRAEVLIQMTASASEKCADLKDTLATGDRIARNGSAVDIIVPMRLKNRSRASKLFDAAGGPATAPRAPDQTLVGAVAKAHGWRARLVSGEAATIAEVAKVEGFTEGFVRQRLKLAYLAPDIVRDVLAGRQTGGLMLQELMDAEWPLEWGAQRDLFGSLSRTAPATPSVSTDWR